MTLTRAHGTNFKIESRCLFQMYNYDDRNKFANSIFQYPDHQDEINLNAAHLLKKKFLNNFGLNYVTIKKMFEDQFQRFNELKNKANELNQNQEKTEDKKKSLSPQFLESISFTSKFSKFQNEIKKVLPKLKWAR